MKKTLISAVTLGLSLGLLSAPAHAAPKISAQSIIVNPLPASLSVQVWTDRDTSGSKVPNYKVNDKIRIYTRVSSDAYVYLFNVDPNGKVDMILPNRFASGANFVKANTVKAFPAAGDQFTFDIAAPYGLNKVLALASLTPLNTSSIASFSDSQSNFAVSNVQGQQQLAQALSIVVNPVQNPIPQNSWISDVAYYNVAYGSTGSAAPVYNSPVVTLPAWNTQPVWRTQFESQQTTAQIYIQYANELQSKGYRLVNRDERGNTVNARFQGDDSAQLIISVRGGKFDVQIIRR
ncbi:DUF4384 domain-containing protein [Deinococcus psychrotolerans]|uniref:DUF4384 domain-containing protein n=1 Tax=Deinococcus psychrotolerans TaxID=2489213 RepID=A0A3G8YE29_9DEIO|nr:DUF4384 domain-containing protein [Deinococcus psychrotolerans]AZI43100.1 DUF4384 domain-containing protein [Deinococcus psychrotolerans]